MKNNGAIGWSCSAVSSVLTIVQTNQIFQLICLILTAISTLISIITSVIIWYKKAKADGKITLEELEELKGISEEARQEIENIINKEEGNNE